MIADGIYNVNPPINGELSQIILSLKQYGQLLGILSSLLLIFVFDVRRRGRVFVVGMMVASAGMGSGLIKTVVRRARPLEYQGKTVVQGIEKGISASRNQSFPSGHTASAVALSYGLSMYYPQTSILVWVLAAGVAFNRWLTVLHFPTDILAGAWVGFVCAAILARSRLAMVAGDVLSECCAPERVRGLHHFRFQWRMYFRRLIASPFLLFAVSLAIHWAGNGSTNLWDRDEPRFATATREMKARGDWIVPTFNGDLRPDKPILVYWLMRLSYTVFGDGPFGALFSGIAGSLACMVVYSLGSRMFDRRVGLLAGWLLALSPMLVVESKLATVDAILLLFIATCFYAVWRAMTEPESKWPAVLFWMSLSAALLAKGPVAIGVLAAGLVPFAMWEKDGQVFHGLRWKWGLPLTLVLVLPWCVAVQLATEGEFLNRAIGHHVVKRSLQPLENHRGFPGYYVITLFGVMAPWAWLLPWSVKEHWSRFRADRRLRFLLCWSIGTLVLFELVRTKLVHYYLPAYPALALWLASALLGRFETSLIGARRLDWHLWLGAVLGGLVIGAGMVGFAVIMLPAPAALPMAVVGITLGVGFICAGILLREHHLRNGFMLAAGTLAVCLFVAGLQLFPALGQERVIVKVADRLREYKSKGAVALWHYCDPSLIYNVGGPLLIVDELQDDPLFPQAYDLARQAGRFICPLKPEHLATMARDPHLKLEVVESISAFDLHGFRIRTVHLVAIQPADGTVHTVAKPESPTSR
ncbi:MAG: glycosyltransferase family 39 protein [Planctomycetota bacterium]